jgi:hypothetical protein
MPRRHFYTNPETEARIELHVSGSVSAYIQHAMHAHMERVLHAKERLTFDVGPLAAQVILRMEADATAANGPVPPSGVRLACVARIRDLCPEGADATAWRKAVIYATSPSCWHYTYAVAYDYWVGHQLGVVPM